MAWSQTWPCKNCFSSSQSRLSHSTENFCLTLLSSFHCLHGY